MSRFPTPWTILCIKTMTIDTVAPVLHSLQAY
jgi:hypothetical protein